MKNLSTFSIDGFEQKNLLKFVFYHGKHIEVSTKSCEIYLGE